MSLGITEFTFCIAIVFLPGIIAFIIVDNFTNHGETKIHHWIVYSFLLNLASYCIFRVLANLANLLFNYNIELWTFEKLFGKNLSIDYYQIFLTSVIAIIIGFLLSFLLNNKYFYKFVCWLSCSDRLDGIDVFEAIMRDKTIGNWVTMHDYERDKIFDGFIQKWSTNYDIREIYLRDVRVYQLSTGNFLYSTPALVLAKKSELLYIELHGEQYSDFAEVGINLNNEIDNSQEVK